MFKMMEKLKAERDKLNPIFARLQQEIQTLLNQKLKIENDLSQKNIEALKVQSKIELLNEMIGDG